MSGTTASILVALLGTCTAVVAMAADVDGTPTRVIAPKNVVDTGRAGVRLLEDYDSFALYEVDPSRRASMAALGATAIDDSLHFNARSFDTQRDALGVLPRFGLQPSGAGLHVVQFVGPVKQAWLEALSARGITPIQYIASNGYLVWMESDAEARLQELRNHSSWLQYSAPLHDFLKASPELITLLDGTTAEVDVMVQIYRHDGDHATRAFLESLAVLSRSQLGPFGGGAKPSDWASVLEFANLTLRVRISDIPLIAARNDVVYIERYVEPTMLDEKQGILLTGDFAPGSTTPSYLQFLIDRGFSQTATDYPVVDVTDSPIDEGGAGRTVANTFDSLLHVRGDLREPSRVAYFKNCSALADEITGGSDGHGSLNGGIIADYDQRTGYPFQDGDGQRLGLGINPLGRIGSTAIFVPIYNIDNCGGTDQGVIQSNWRSGARISSNSWGAAVSGRYDATAQAYDVGVRDADPTTPGNQEMIYVFSAGNAGAKQSTVGSPGTAKNVITVGASENLRPFISPIDSRCGFDPANDPSNIADFSARGPVQGGRTKPEVVAPGTHVQAGASNYSGYDGSSICVKYFPEVPAQQLFTYSSGTSHSAPAVAGVASLAYWWISHGGAGSAAGSVAEVGGNRTPSPALMKAWLIAHPSYLDGVGGNDDLPSDAQGFGMPNMRDMFADTPKFLVDQSEVFDRTGEVRSYTLAVVDPTKPVRVALAYTDAPGALLGGAIVNDLDLVVKAGGNVFHGNSFNRQWSIPGGETDHRNNYEAVYLPASLTSEVTVLVSASNIAGDGVPNAGDATDQDYALVCSNCKLVPTFTLSTPQLSPSVCIGNTFFAPVTVGSIDGYRLPVTLSASGAPPATTEFIGPATVVPPGATTLSISGSSSVVPGHYPVRVVGASATAGKTLDLNLAYAASAPPAPGLVAPLDGASEITLRPVLIWESADQASTYLVEVASDPQFAHVIASEEIAQTQWTIPVELASSTRYFWRVGAINGCGQSIDLLFANGFDATPPPAPQAFSFSTLAQPGDCAVGYTPTTLFQDDMESGAPGWGLGGDINGSHWAIGTQAHSGTHALLADHDPFLAFEQDLRSPAITLPSGLARISLSFWNQQSLSGIAGAACFQGALLRIALDGGATQSQITAGLLTDSYDGVVSSSGGNPLQGRPAWCGNPQGYLDSVVDLTPYAGHTIRLTFAIADDIVEDGVGRPPDPAWAIDDVKVTGCTLRATR